MYCYKFSDLSASTIVEEEGRPTDRPLDEIEEVDRAVGI